MFHSVVAILTLAWANAVGAAPAAPDKPKAVDLDRSHVWRVEGEDGFVLVRGRRVDDIRRDPKEVVRAINTVLARIALDHGGPVAKGDEGPPTIRLRAIQGGTATVDVIGASYLAERMGTTGAEGWLAAATFTITEIPGVKAVEFRFEEGSHASPGRHTRAHFGRFKVIRE